ncbi:MAG: hypothetical protein IAF08_15695 [Rhizobacter sp.]|nr:hypothetical protein [Chlorobiales bacterium]
MGKSQLGVMIEPHRILFVQIEKELNQYFLRFQEELPVEYDIYTEILEGGQPKRIAELTTKLTELFGRFEEKKIAVCLPMSGVRSVVAHLDLGLEPEEQAAELDLSATSFISDAEDYLLQPSKLETKEGDPFERHFLSLMPKRHLNRLRMLMLPTRKELNLVDLSHFGYQNLYERQFDRRGILELEQDYIVLSVLNYGLIESMVHIPITDGDDASYFALSELKAIHELRLLHLCGSRATDDAKTFIASACGIRTEMARYPANTILKRPTGNDAKFLAVFGCTAKALNYF